MIGKSIAATLLAAFSILGFGSAGVAFDPDCNCDVGANVWWNGVACGQAAVLKLSNGSANGKCKSDCSGVDSPCDNRYILQVSVGGFNSVQLSRDGTPVRCDDAPGLSYQCIVNVCGGLDTYVVKIFSGQGCTGDLLCHGFLWCSCNGCTAPIE